MHIDQSGSQPSARGLPDHFSGSVRIDPCFKRLVVAPFVVRRVICGRSPAPREGSERNRCLLQCSAGPRSMATSVEEGMVIHKYWSSVCPRCALQAKCTTSDSRRIGRWEHEAVLDKMQGRLDANPEAMQIRRQTGEHPLGTIKAWIGATHFLCRRLPRVRRR
jgi:hypothetical protein